MIDNNIVVHEYSEFETPVVSPYQYAAVMRGLSRCKSSYRNHVKEMGGVSKADVAAWCEALREMNEDRIDAAFAKHVKHQNYWPKFVDIVAPEGRTAKDSWTNSDPVNFGFDTQGRVSSITSGVPDPTRLMLEERSPVVPSSLTGERKVKFDSLMSGLRDDPEVQRRAKAAQALLRIADIRRKANGGTRNPSYGKSPHSVDSEKNSGDSDAGDNMRLVRADDTLQSLIVSAKADVVEKPAAPLTKAEIAEDRTVKPRQPVMA